MKMAFEVADQLEATGRSTAIVSVHTLKPLDTEGLARVLGRFGQVIVIEEHSQVGGLAAQVKQIAWDCRAACDLRTFSLKDEFIHSLRLPRRPPGRARPERGPDLRVGRQTPSGSTPEPKPPGARPGMAEINLLERYPQSKRSVADRGPAITEEVREVARRYGRDYFDGDRRYGYGGYSYHPRFWQETVRLFHDHYGLADDASVLDVGCAKGFMLHDFKLLYPGMTVAGIDISEYAIENAIETMKPFLRVGNAKELPFPDRSFDLVTAINTIHNLPLDECKQCSARDPAGLARALVHRGRRLDQR